MMRKPLRMPLWMLLGMKTDAFWRDNGSIQLDP